MTPIEGRELDRAVAVAMGWTQTDKWPEFVPDECWVPPGFKIPYGLPGFSSDAEHLPEMLEWLHEQGVVCVTIGHYAERVNVSAASPVADYPHATGADISEAVARLVVAVAQLVKAG